ncbi:VOC family protein [Celerinatantimonas yamalensis]|uniref:VOC family protein n=1 Tax=Celerinatantimonas yamalensis TaxID=559956 RepID=A0ABW9G128_9GAMM
MITGINHVQVTIPFGTEEDARYFYCDVLGLTEIEKPNVLKKNGGIWLQLGSLQVHLGCENNDHRADSKAHIAYNVSDLDMFRAKFDKLGVKIYENTQIEGFKRFDIRDPFGNRIELMQPNA